MLLDKDLLGDQDVGPKPPATKRPTAEMAGRPSGLGPVRKNPLLPGASSETLRSRLLRLRYHAEAAFELQTAVCK